MVFMHKIAIQTGIFGIFAFYISLLEATKSIDFENTDIQRELLNSSLSEYKKLESNVSRKKPSVTLHLNIELSEKKNKRKKRDYNKDKIRKIPSVKGTLSKSKTYLLNQSKFLNDLNLISSNPRKNTNQKKVDILKKDRRSFNYKKLKYARPEGKKLYLNQPKKLNFNSLKSNKNLNSQIKKNLNDNTDDHVDSNVYSVIDDVLLDLTSILTSSQRNLQINTTFSSISYSNQISLLSVSSSSNRKSSSSYFSLTGLLESQFNFAYKSLSSKSSSSLNYSRTNYLASSLSYLSMIDSDSPLLDSYSKYLVSSRKSTNSSVASSSQSNFSYNSFESLLSFSSLSNSSYKTIVSSIYFSSQSDYINNNHRSGIVNFSQEYSFLSGLNWSSEYFKSSILHYLGNHTLCLSSLSSSNLSLSSNNSSFTASLDSSFISSFLNYSSSDYYNSSFLASFEMFNLSESTLSHFNYVYSSLSYLKSLTSSNTTSSLKSYSYSLLSYASFSLALSAKSYLSHIFSSASDNLYSSKLTSFTQSYSLSVSNYSSSNYALSISSISSFVIYNSSSFCQSSLSNSLSFISKTLSFSSYIYSSNCFLSSLDSFNSSIIYHNSLISSENTHCSFYDSINHKSLSLFSLLSSNSSYFSQSSILNLPRNLIIFNAYDYTPTPQNDICSNLQYSSDFLVNHINSKKLDFSSEQCFLSSLISELNHSLNKVTCDKPLIVCTVFFTETVSVTSTIDKTITLNHYTYSCSASSSMPPSLSTSNNSSYQSSTDEITEETTFTSQCEIFTITVYQTVSQILSQTHTLTNSTCFF